MKKLRFYDRNTKEFYTVFIFGRSYYSSSVRKMSPNPSLGSYSDKATTSTIQGIESKPNSESNLIVSALKDKKEERKEKLMELSDLTSSTDSSKKQLDSYETKYNKNYEELNSKINSLKESRPDIAGKIKKIEETPLYPDAPRSRSSLNEDPYSEGYNHKEHILGLTLLYFSDIEKAKDVAKVVASNSNMNDPVVKKYVREIEVRANLANTYANDVTTESDVYYSYLLKEKSYTDELNRIDGEIKELEAKANNDPVNSELNEKMGELISKREELTEFRKALQDKDSECANKETQSLDHLQISDNKIGQLRSKLDLDPLLENLDKEKDRTIGIIQTQVYAAKENNDVKSAVISNSVLTEVKIKANSTVLEIASDQNDIDRETKRDIKKATKSLDVDTYKNENLKDDHLKLVELHSNYTEKEKEVSQLEEEVKVLKYVTSETDKENTSVKVNTTNVSSDDSKEVTWKSWVSELWYGNKAEGVPSNLDDFADSSTEPGDFTGGDD